MVSCPCSKQTSCKDRRESIVNLVLNERICTANELKERLEKEQGNWATRKSLEFLRSGRCEHLSILKDLNDDKIQFKNHGMLFYRKDVPKAEIELKVLMLLTNFQLRLLDTLKKYDRSVYYFSTYDFKKLLPYLGVQVNYALKRLCNLNLIIKMRLGKTDFYTLPNNVSRFKKNCTNILVEDYAEYLIAKRVHELVMNLYPSDLIKQWEGALRPSTKDVIAVTGGMTFDIFYQFEESIGVRSFLAIDVYSRFKLNGWAVYSLLNKIKWAKSIIPNGLKDKTYE